jgi:hypothetical protein
MGIVPIFFPSPQKMGTVPISFMEKKNDANIKG